MEKVLNKIALYIYSAFGQKIEKYSKTGHMLISLNPGREKRELLKEYYVNKIRRIITVFLAMTMVMAAVIINVCTDSTIDKEGRLPRRDYRSGSYDMSLIAETEGNKYDIDITVKERIYTREETDRMYYELCDRLGEIIRGDNESLDHVTNDLNIVGYVEGYPFRIRWESGNYEYIHEDGKITDKDIPKEGEKANLLCVMTYEDRTYEHLMDIVLYPKDFSPEETVKNEIIASIRQVQEDTKNNEYLKLPESVGGKGIVWKDVPGSEPAVMAIMSILILFAIWWGTDNDLAKKYGKRDQLLRLEYSEFVSKLQLLISSGMTIRGAFERMEADYKSALKENGNKKYVYEELAVCLKRLRDGASESEVYILFGNRCGQMAYRKLMTLLTQNLRKGTGKIVEALNNEIREAFEEQKQIARRMGDEAQTKLLFPMVIMLSIVMIIIMVPAYFSFGA